MGMGLLMENIQGVPKKSGISGFDDLGHLQGQKLWLNSPDQYPITQTKCSESFFLMRNTTLNSMGPILGGLKMVFKTGVNFHHFY